LVFVRLLFYSFPFSSFHFPSSCRCIPDIFLPLFSPCRTRPFCDLVSTPLSSYWLSSHHTFPYPAVLSSSFVTGFLSYLESWPVRMGPIRCPETSVNNYHTTPCNNQEDHRFQSPSKLQLWLLCAASRSRKGHCVVVKNQGIRLQPCVEESALIRRGKGGLGSDVSRAVEVQRSASETAAGVS
jgi:hypothetical protein